MDLLIDNPLASMYGPYFLLIYAVVIFFSIILLFIIKQMIDNSGRLNIPTISTSVDPFEISYLRGKEEELARSVIFSLTQKEYIEYSQGTSSFKKIENGKSADRLTKIEQITLNWLGKERSTAELFSPNGLLRQLESYSRQYKDKLERQQLLIDDDTRQKFRVFKWFFLLLVLGLGGYKTFAAVMHGKFNIIFIIGLAVIGFLILNAVSGLPRISKLGQSYLRRLQLAFDSLKKSAFVTDPSGKGLTTAQSAAFTGVDPMLLSVGIFGGGILAGTAFDAYHSAFARAYQHQGSSGASCGSSCGSCSSCSSGSSCSSCSSCGGGCGGCGGCS